VWGLLGVVGLVAALAATLDILGIFLALSSRDKRVRATAQEFLETLALDCEDRARDLLRLAADDLEPRERVARSQVHVGARPANQAEALARLLADPDEALAALAAYHALALGIIDGEVATTLDERPELRYVADAAGRSLPPQPEASHG